MKKTKSYLWPVPACVRPWSTKQFISFSVFTYSSRMASSSRHFHWLSRVDHSYKMTLSISFSLFGRWFLFSCVHMPLRSEFSKFSCHLSVAPFLTDFNFNVFSMHAKNLHSLWFGRWSCHIPLCEVFRRKTNWNMTNTVTSAQEQKKFRLPKWIVWIRIPRTTESDRFESFIYGRRYNVHVSDFIVNWLKTKHEKCDKDKTKIDKAVHARTQAVRKHMWFE